MFDWEELVSRTSHPWRFLSFMTGGVVLVFWQTPSCTAHNNTKMANGTAWVITSWIAVRADEKRLVLVELAELTSQGLRQLFIMWEKLEHECRYRWEIFISDQSEAWKHQKSGNRSLHVSSLCRVVDKRRIVVVIVCDRKVSLFPYPHSHPLTWYLFVGAFQLYVYLLVQGNLLIVWLEY